jgi:hypothetical protein
MNLVSSVKTAWQYKHNKDDDHDNNKNDDNNKNNNNNSLAYFYWVMVIWLTILYGTMRQCHLLLLLSTSICNSGWFYSWFPCKQQTDISTNNALLTLITQKWHQNLLPQTLS